MSTPTYRLPPGYDGPVNRADPVPDGEARISIFGYTPSLVLAIIAVVTFGVAFAGHLFHLRRRGTRAFHGLFAFGCAMELVGFGMRASANSNPFVVNRFIVSYFMTITAPVFFSAGLYLALSTVAQRSRSGAERLPLRPRTIVATFVTLDVVTIALQVVGAALIGVAESSRASGETPPLTSAQANNILLAGLSAQCAAFLVFLTIVAITGVRRALDGRFVIFLAVTSFLIFLRTVFRLAETAEGVFGTAARSEVLFGILEYAPVILCVLPWAILPLVYWIRWTEEADEVMDEKSSVPRA